jgi:hypothetical protein
MQANKQSTPSRSDSKKGSSKSKGSGESKGTRASGGRRQLRSGDDLPGVGLGSVTPVDSYQGGASDVIEDMVNDSENRQETLRQRETTGQFTMSRENTNTNHVLQRSAAQVGGPSYASPLNNVEGLDSSQATEAAGAVRNVARSRFAKAMLERQAPQTEAQEAKAVTNRQTSNSFDDDLPRVGLVKDKS